MASEEYSESKLEDKNLLEERIEWGTQISRYETKRDDSAIQTLYEVLGRRKRSGSAISREATETEEDT